MKLLLFLTIILQIHSERPIHPYDIVQDLTHVEDYEHPLILDFEDFDYQSMERNIFLQKSRNNINSIIKFYQSTLNKILTDKAINNQNASEFLVPLLGKDFEYLDGDVREQEIKIKAFIERELDLFFLAECSSKYFKDKVKFDICQKLQEELKFFLMFENFFDIGWENQVEEILERIGADDEFKNKLTMHLLETKVYFKLPMNLLTFSFKQIKVLIIHSIEKRFGKGLRFVFYSTVPQEDVETEVHDGTSIEEIENAPEEVIVDKEEFRHNLTNTMKEMLNSEFEVTDSGDVEIENYLKKKWGYVELTNLD